MKHALSALFSLAVLTACTPPPAELDGLWFGASQAKTSDFAEIRLSMHDGKLQADGAEVSVDKGYMTIAYPTGAAYVAPLPEENKTVEGFYIQPSNEMGGQRLAQLLKLRLDDSGQWSATPTPLKGQYSLFIGFQQTPEETLNATLLNPERNFTGSSRTYQIVQTTEGEFQLMPPDQTEPFTTLKLNENQDALLIGFGPLDAFELKPVNKTDPRAQEFYGETGRDQLQTPHAGGSWKTGELANANLDEKQMLELVQKLASESGFENRRNLVNSLLIARNGELVVEEYFRGFERDTPHDIRSAGKTFASVLVGALRQQEYELDADTPIEQFIPMAGQPETRPVSLGDLLTHRSGLECYDGNYESAGNEDAMWNQSEYKDLRAFTAALPQVVAPGERYAYCSGGINLVGAAISGATGKPLLEVLQESIFEPLGFKNAYWNTMPNNEAYLGGGAQLRPRDLLKIGQLYLDNGKWNGQQLIDQDWVELSLAPQAEITPATTGLSEEDFNQFYFGGTDGLAWHLHKITVGDRQYESYEASGNGGQMVVVIPELDMVVGLTGGNYGQGYIWGRWRQNIIGDQIIAALN